MATHTCKHILFDSFFLHLLLLPQLTRLFPNTASLKGLCRFAVFKTGIAAGLCSRLSPSCHKPYQEPANTASQIPEAQIPPGSTKCIQQQKLPPSITEHRKWHVKTSRNWLATDVNSFILLLSFFKDLCCLLWLVMTGWGVKGVLCPHPGHSNTNPALELLLPSQPAGGTAQQEHPRQGRAHIGKEEPQDLLTQLNTSSVALLHVK